jgi:hypothetical protein
MLGIVFSSGAWTASVSAIAAAAGLAAVVLLRDYLRLESRARSLQTENDQLHNEIRSLTDAPADRDSHGGRPMPGQRRGPSQQGSSAGGSGRFASAVESVRRAS